MPNHTTLSATSTIDELVHAIVVLGMISANMFVKNKGSRVFASNIINLTNQIVLPYADSLLLGQNDMPQDDPATSAAQSMSATQTTP